MILIRERRMIQSLLPDLRQSLLLKVLMSRVPRKLCNMIVRMRMRRKMNASN